MPDGTVIYTNAVLPEFVEDDAEACARFNACVCWHIVPGAIPLTVPHPVAFHGSGRVLCHPNVLPLLLAGDAAAEDAS